MSTAGQHPDTGHGHGHGHGAHPDHDEVFDRDFWENKYRTSDPAALRHEPNPYLLVIAETLTPGRVLDAGCGPGAEAVWLARRGWEVTALDISSVALDHARAIADQEGPDVAARITWQQADLTAWTAPADGYDLVCTNYVHALEDIVPRLAAAVRPGGTLLVVDHFDILAVLDPAEWRPIPMEARSRVVAAFDGTEKVLDDRVMAAVRIAPTTP
ncbi:class I SAM-dependent methyltransferase [Herbidospora sp. NBRC 101105]|uniref:class I SAM-dependent methyltransferase n=1 Tax=Herbidospora sp. NBRC 101105 TaxID=3032195 RepID=UPI002554A4F7|nr:class I SAM-dependent methyltransferase [Herbidospora sp. NBRC 101105]